MNKYDINIGLQSDFALAVSLGLVPGVSGVHKFGAAPSGIQATLTDVWSRADATPTQQIWLAPTAAAIHDIKSTDAGDDGAPVGVGARTIRIYGLKTWDSLETSEDITLNGTTVVPTVNSYVIIHRMKVLTSGATNINIGTITATAKAPSATTITAVILPGEGQTEMAIYGVPSVQNFSLTRFQAQMNKASGTVGSVSFSIRVNPNPDVQTTNFVVKDDISVQSTGANVFAVNYSYYPKFAGPCIIKVQGIASTADTDAFAGFDGFLTLK